MQLTPEQRAEMDRERCENPTARGVHVKLTPEQRDEYLRIAAAEDAGREANIGAIRKRDLAAEEPGFSGDLRRAINAARRPSRELAAQLGIDVRLLEEFRAGEATLQSDAVDRLVHVLGLRLVAETH